MECRPLVLDAPPRLVAAGIGRHHPAPGTRWRLPRLWAFHCYTYHATLELAGHLINVRPGTWSLTLPDTTATYGFQGPSEHWYAHFEPVAGTPVPVPLAGDLGPDFPAVDHALRQALGGSPRRQQSTLWQVLCRVTEDPVDADTQDPWRRITRLVAARLAEPLALDDLAEEVGLSPSSLLRLSRARTGVPLMAWIRRQRLERARHLLRHSTLPVAAVGEAVGYPDPQAFNKVLRAAFGKPPSRLR